MEVSCFCSIKPINMACWKMGHLSIIFLAIYLHSLRGFSRHVWWHQRVIGYNMMSKTLMTSANSCASRLATARHQHKTLLLAAGIQQSATRDSSRSFAEIFCFSHCQLIGLREKIQENRTISWDNLWFPVDFPYWHGGNARSSFDFLELSERKHHHAKACIVNHCQLEILTERERR